VILDVLVNQALMESKGNQEILDLMVLPALQEIQLRTSRANALIKAQSDSRVPKVKLVAQVAMAEPVYPDYPDNPVFQVLKAYLDLKVLPGIHLLVIVVIQVYLALMETPVWQVNLVWWVRRVTRDWWV